MTESTPSQTVGPFLAIVLPWPDGPDVVSEGGVLITGRLLDGAGEPVPDGLIETWQADPDGRFDHPSDPRGAVRYQGFRGFGRCPTAADGRFVIRTRKPGALPTPQGEVEAPHLNVTVFARGLLKHVVTRLYFPDEQEANAADPSGEGARLAAAGAGEHEQRAVAVVDGRRLGLGEVLEHQFDSTRRPIVRL